MRHADMAYADEQRAKISRLTTALAAAEAAHKDTEDRLRAQITELKDAHQAALEAARNEYARAMQGKAESEAALAAERERAEKAEARLKAHANPHAETYNPCDLCSGHACHDCAVGDMAAEMFQSHDARDAALASLAAAEAERDRLRNLPVVGGSYVEGTLDDLSHRAQVHLELEQEKPLPDNALIAVLCDTVRLVREWGRHTEAHVEFHLAAAREDAVRGFAEWADGLQPQRVVESIDGMWRGSFKLMKELYLEHLAFLASRKEPSDG